jgi:hypothetical protein
MSTVRRRGLQIDDPLAPRQPATPDNPPPESAEPAPSAIQAGPVQASTRDPQPGRRAKVGGGSRPASADKQGSRSRPAVGHGDSGDSGVWRGWSGITGVGSFRLPHELLVELGATARELGLPIGMIVTAAITQLLDQPPEQIARLVDRADDARIQGRRNARRRLSERTEG